MNDYEVIVIGSGATGGVAALTFAEAGVKVLVVEAGPKYTSEEAIGSEPINTLNRINGIVSGKRRIQAQHPGYWKSNPLLFSNEKDNPYTFPQNKPFIWTQGKQLGGRSLTWGGITLRLSDYEFKASLNDGYGSEWPIKYSDLSPHYESLESRLGIRGSRDGLKQLPDGNYLDPLPFTVEENEFANKVRQRLGYPVIHSRGFGPFKSNEDGEWPKYSSLGSTLKAAIETGNVQIISNQKVERIIMNKDRTRAESILIVDQNNGQRSKLRAELFILCASTIQSIRILLSSEENECEKGLIDPSQKIGKNIMDHISMCRFFTIKNRNDLEHQKPSKISKTLSGAGSFFIPLGSRLERQDDNNFIRGYGIWGGIGRFEPPKCLKRFPNHSTGFLIGHGEVLARENNKVTLSNKKDKWGISVPHIEFMWGNNERNMSNHMNKTLISIIEKAGGEMLPLKDIFKFPFVEPLIEGAVALGNEPPPPGYYIHEVGGAAMGSKEGNSVVDRFNRLWRCQNVLVVDGACWPTSAWQSPTLTMMAIARRACQSALKHQND